MIGYLYNDKQRIYSPSQCDKNTRKDNNIRGQF